MNTIMKTPFVIIIPQETKGGKNSLARQNIITQYKETQPKIDRKLSKNIFIN